MLYRMTGSSLAFRMHDHASGYLYRGTTTRRPARTTQQQQCEQHLLGHRINDLNRLNVVSNDR